MQDSPEIVVPQCPNCNAELVQATAKNGSIYYRCPNWKPQNRGCQGFQWFPPREKKQKPVESGTKNVALEMIFLLQEIRDILLRIEMRKEQQDIDM